MLIVGERETRKEVKNMTDKLEFDYAIKRAGLTREKVAKVLNVSEATLSDRVNNKSIFRSNEIGKLMDLLKIESIDELKRIFFAQNVED
jgi:transcriptional regulator with XRE-family HTH domain